MSETFGLPASLTRYTKVRTTISRLIRSRPFHLSRKRWASRKLLNVGCGPNTPPEFVNLDYHWQPGVDVCWDITGKPYPFADGSFEGVYTEHCLEHIPFEDCQRNLEAFHRLLAPGGTVRVVVPDGELYIDLYVRKRAGEDVKMPYEEGYLSPMARINGVFRNHGHLFIYDFETLGKMLEKAGFKDVKKETFRKGRDPRLLVDSESRAFESLYVEASK